MGGKPKQSQRTKNNARPSSSSRSAELLSSGDLEGGFFTQTSANSSALFPTLAAVNLEQGLKPEFITCIRKLGKKDPITRTKGLQELSELVANADVEDVVATLPCWAHYYKILTVDTDRKVREVTQTCHGALVSRAGRRAAPVLRALAPAWLLAAHDAHAPAACVARRTLQTTFPDAKLPEVIAYCKAEIMAQLIDNLLGNAEANINKKISDADEREMQLSLILSSSLQTLQFFIEKLPAAHDEWLWSELKPLLEHKAFWKLAHSSDMVRASWCVSLGGVCCHFPRVVCAPVTSRVLRALLAAAIDPQPRVSANAWISLVAIMSHVPEWYTYLDQKELLVKRILDVLRNGGWGDAKHITNMILTLLKQLPEDILTKEFYESLYNAIFTGLEKKNILSSKSERQAWMSTLAECLHFLSTQEYDFVSEVVSSVQRTWLERVFAMEQGQLKKNLLKTTATNITDILKDWHVRCEEHKDSKYDKFIRIFWHNLEFTILREIEKCSADEQQLTATIEYLQQLFEDLQLTYSPSEEQPQIKFADLVAAEEAAEAEAVAEEEAGESGAPECGGCAEHERRLRALVLEASARGLQLAGARQLRAALAPLAQLLQRWDAGGALLRGVAARLGAAGLRGLCEEARRWLRAADMCCEPVVDLLFLALRHMPDRDQRAVFHSFQQLPMQAVQWCLARAAAQRSPACDAWLQSEAAARALCELCELAAGPARAGAGRARRLLQACAARAGPATHACLLDITARRVRVATEADDDSLLYCGVLAVWLLLKLPQTAPRRAADLAFQLFCVNLRVPRDSGRLPEDLWDDLRTAWRAAISDLPDDEMPECHRKIYEWVISYVEDDMELELQTDKMERVADALVWLARDMHVLALLAAAVLQGADHVAQCPRRADMARGGRPCAAALALRHACVVARLSCLSACPPLRMVLAGASQRAPPDLKRPRLLLLANHVLLRAALLATALRRAGDHDRAELFRNQQLREDMLDMFYFYVLLRTFHEGYAFWPDYNIIDETMKKLDSLIAEVIDTTPEFAKKETEKFLMLKSKRDGCLWAEAHRYYHHLTVPNGYDSSEDDNTDNKDALLTNVQTNNEVPSNADVQANNDDKTNLVDQKNNDIQTTDAVQIKNDDQEIKDGQTNNDVQTNKEGKTNNDNHDESDDTDSERKENGKFSVVGKDDVMFKVPHKNCHIKDQMSGHGFFHSLQASTRYRQDPEFAYRLKFLVMVRCWQSVHGLVGAASMPAWRLDDHGHSRCNLDLVLDVYHQRTDTMLYDRDISDCSWDAVVCNVAVVEYLRDMVELYGWDSPAHYWDFTTITLCSLLDAIVKSKENWTTTLMAMLTRSVLGLYVAVHTFVQQIRARSVQRQPPPHVADLVTEWNDIFAPDTTFNLLSLTLHILESSGAVGFTLWSGSAAALEALCGALDVLQWDALSSAARRQLALQRCVRVATEALARPAPRAVALLAHRLLHALARPLVLDDAEKLSAWSDENVGDDDEQKNRPQFCFDYFHDTFTHLHEMVEATLSSIVLGEETCELVAMTDGYNATLCWLLLAELLHEMCALARGDLKHHYTQLYRERRYAEALLDCALRLLPAGVRAAAEDDQPARDHAAFQRAPALAVLAPAVSEDVGDLACRALYASLSGAGASPARSWWGAARPRPARLLERLVQLYVAPHAARSQLSHLQQRAHELADTEVRIAWSASEVTCLYTVEERVIELQVQLSRSHPLVAPRLTAPDASGVGSNTQWVALYLAYQNGTLLNALKMWTAAVNAKVESSPQCYICYCRLHPHSGRLPRVRCHQCSNRFHTECLRKWFQTSGKSSCPLCRSSF